MSFEAWSLAASAGTFLVIAATAIAAIVQLRHMRSSSQITALSKLEDMWDDPALVNARRRLLKELHERLKDPQFRAELKADTSQDELVLCMNSLCNFYETMGVYVKHRLADRDVVCDFWSASVIQAWRGMTPAIAIVRTGSIGDRVWDNFEYMVTVAQRFTDKYPNGTFPQGTPRLPLETTEHSQK
jgi:hypothetical protein